MGRFIDLTGRRFGRLAVIERDLSKPKNNGVYWLCECDCGGQVSVRSKDLRRGFTKSCGCLRRDSPSHVSKLEHFGEDGYTLDRIDVDGNYEPGNVRWATDSQQRRNRTDNHFINANGERMILADVAEAAGVHKATIHNRIKRGLTGGDLLKPAHR